MAESHPFGRDRICAVAAAPTARGIWRQIHQALRFTTTVELRLDWLRSEDERSRLLARLRRSRLPGRAQFIATLRRRDAGGRYAGGIVQQLLVLQEAIRAGCKWTDLEIESASRVAPFVLDLYTRNAKRIFSAHDFRGTCSTERLARWQREFERLGSPPAPQAIKIAAHCHSIHDAMRLVRLARKGRKVIAVPMGEIGRPGRVLALREGSALAYAPVEKPTAPGQIPLEEMTTVYRADRMDRHTLVYGVIGDPVAHSLSPVLHNAGFQKRRVNAVYLPFRVKNLPDFLGAIARFGIRGFSVTLPHKERILQHLDGCDPLAKAIGAVNTVVVRGGGELFGYNTDYVGVLRALEQRMPIPGSRILIFGAGGAARAVALALVRGGAAVSVCARREAQAKKLASSAGGAFLSRKGLPKESFDAIVNTTPVGMHPAVHRTPLRARELNCRLVFDTIYRPRETQLLKLARKKGIEIVSGVEMFLAQGVAQWEIWMGERAPQAEMRRMVLRALRREERAQEEK